MQESEVYLLLLSCSAPLSRQTYFLLQVVKKTTNILDSYNFWHPWERVICLSGYQFLIVSYKVLFPKTFAGKYLCEGLYDESELSTPSWYIDWKHEIESLTFRSLRLSEINTTKSINEHHRRRSIAESVNSINIS